MVLSPFRDGTKSPGLQPRPTRRALSSSQNPLTFQQLVLRLQTFWAENGCVLQQPYDVEVGAGTMAPETFLRVLGPKPYRVGYVQPSRRPADGRYGENPNRLFKHMQFQVILKPPPANVQDLYLESLKAIGIDLDPISAELTYGLERIAAFLQDVDSIYDITWVVDPDGRPVKYGEIRLQDELQFSVYNFEWADVEKAWKHLELYETECQALLVEYAASTRSELASGDKRTAKSESLLSDSDEVQMAKSEERRAAVRRYPLLAAFDLCLKCSHLFNILDARGAISVTERVGVIARIRALAVGVAKAYVDQQQADEKLSEARRAELETCGS